MENNEKTFKVQDFNEDVRGGILLYMKLIGGLGEDWKLKLSKCIGEDFMTTPVEKWYGIMKLKSDDLEKLIKKINRKYSQNKRAK